jgi:hypothetical protein
MTKGFSANANTTLDKRAFQKRRLIFIQQVLASEFSATDLRLIATITPRMDSMRGEIP